MGQSGNHLHGSVHADDYIVTLPFAYEARRLSRDQLDVLSLLLEGLSLREAAAKRDKSISSVQDVRRRALKTMNVENVGELTYAEIMEAGTPHVDGRPLCEALSTLGERQFEMGYWASMGYKSREIAKRMGLSWRSVNETLRVCYRKAGVKDRFQLMSLYMSTGLIPMPELATGKQIENLTDVEKKVARLAALGATGPEAALELGTSESTVKNHLSNVYAKLGVNGQKELMVAAIDCGFISVREAAYRIEGYAGIIRKFKSLRYEY